MLGPEAFPPPGLTGLELPFPLPKKLFGSGVGVAGAVGLFGETVAGLLLAVTPAEWCATSAPMPANPIKEPTRAVLLSWTRRARIRPLPLAEASGVDCKLGFSDVSATYVLPIVCHGRNDPPHAGAAL